MNEGGSVVGPSLSSHVHKIGRAEQAYSSLPEWDDDYYAVLQTK
jgi:hypothetical protein